MNLRMQLRPQALMLGAIAALALAAAAVLPALAAAPSEAKLEVNENCVESEWPCWAMPNSGAHPKPASRIAISTGGEVKFTDDASTAAAVVWAGSAPTCTGVPTSPMTKWEGMCKFEAPGTYKFESSTLFNGGPSLNYTKYEVVVEAASTSTSSTSSSTTTATTSTSTTTTMSSKSGGSSPLEGGSGALKLADRQRGSTVRGSIDVSAAGSGGQLKVSLFAARASLAKAGRPPQRVGRLVRSSLKAGNVSFAVPLNTRGRTALRRHRRLALTVKVMLTPQYGAAVTLTRAVVVHI